MLKKAVLFAILAATAAATVPQLVSSLLPGAEAGAEEGQPIAASATLPVPESARTERVVADARGHYTAGFTLNGRQVEALIDTGASAVAINRSTARRIGIGLAQADFRHQVATANGRTLAASATIGSMRLGRIEIRDVQALVLEDAALESALVGMSFLNRLRSFSAEAGVLHLEQ